VSALRVGQGFDAHRLVAGRPLVLGGVQVPFERGLEGHSDGDCLLHAVCDALLGAAAAGDMGRHFPTSDDRWKGASSLLFLDEAARLVQEKGYEVENVDATVIAEEPRLLSHLDAMRETLSRHLGLEKDAVSVKAKSSDGLGALGRAEGIAAQAIVLLSRKDASRKKGSA
jgi:2-C-methyl-D-erythritol 2,4-cyclodiphosphate synthase